MDPKGESTVSNAAAAGSSGAAQLRPTIAPNALRTDLDQVQLSRVRREFETPEFHWRENYHFANIIFPPIHEAALSLPSRIHDTKQPLV